MVLKYALKNIKNMFIYNPIFSGLIVICVFISAIVINMSYGIFVNYKLAIQEDLTEYNLISFDFDEENIVTKEELDQCFRQIMEEEDHWNNEIGIVRTRYMIDGAKYDSAFEFKNKQIATSETIHSNRVKYGQMRPDTPYFTDEQQLSGECVALIYDEQGHGCSIEGLDEVLVSDEIAMIDGREYKIIGKSMDTVGPAEVPYNSLDENQSIQYVVMLTKEPYMSKQTYQGIVDIMNQNLGDRIIEIYYQSMDVDNTKLFKTMIMISFLLSIIAALNFEIIYKFLLFTRKKQNAIMRICGMDIKQEMMMETFECIIINIPIYVTAIAVFVYGILPIISKSLLYINLAYSLKTYAAIFAVYLLIMVIICSNIIVKNEKDTSIKQYRNN